MVHTADVHGVAGATWEVEIQIVWMTGCFKAIRNAFEQNVWCDPANHAGGGNGVAVFDDRQSLFQS